MAEPTDEATLSAPAAAHPVRPRRPSRFAVTAAPDRVMARSPDRAMTGARAVGSGLFFLHFIDLFVRVLGDERRRRQGLDRLRDLDLAAAGELLERVALDLVGPIQLDAADVGRVLA